MRYIAIYHLFSFSALAAGRLFDGLSWDKNVPHAIHNKASFVSDSTDHISLTVGYWASMGLGYALGTYLHPEEIAEPVNAFLNVATTGISHLFKHSIPEGEAGHYHYEYTMTIWGCGVNHQKDQCTIIRCEKGCRETTIDWYSIIGFYANENWGE